MNKSPVPLVLLVLLCCCAALSSARAAQAQGVERPLVLNTDGAPPHSRDDGSGFEDRIVTELFRRIGRAVRLVRLPSERALTNADQGVDDGNYVRVAGLSAQYPNLVMVPEPMSEFAFTAFTRDPKLANASWEQLRAHRTGIVTGWKLAERHLAGATRLTSVRDEETLFAMLMRGRLDVAVSSRHTGPEVLRAHGYQGVRALDPPLSVQPMYLYMNKRHAGLVLQLTAALRAMRRDGTLARITREGLAEAARSTQ